MMVLHRRRAVLPDIAADVIQGLTSSPKRLAPRLFYDTRGSELFDRITELPEYYLTRTERQILSQHADEIIAEAGLGLSLIELGAGSAGKTQLLLRAALRRQLAVTFYPIDLSASALALAQQQIESDLPRVLVKPLVGDYDYGLDRLRHVPGQKLVLFIGSSIGNFEPAQAAGLLRRMRGALRNGDALLLGTDMVKDAAVLHDAYNDAAGVTAEFNRNVLVRINRELGADFELRCFDHYAVWNPVASRIEMYLISTRRQQAWIPGADLRVFFEAGERIHTENSYKFTQPVVKSLIAEGGFDLERTWSDERGWFSVHLGRAA
jgi:L-histidine N-alpha-methyltransferase